MVNNIFLVIQFFVILAVAMVWFVHFEWSAEESIGVSIMIITSIVYLGGLLDNGVIALAIVYIMALVGIISFVFAIRVKELSSTVLNRKDFFSPGVVILFIVFLYGVIAFNGIKINNWDELHHWAKAVNYMLHNDLLPMGEDFDGAEVLLSSTTLFHYFFCKLPKVMTRTIVESNMYVSNLVLWFSAVILPLSRMSWKQWKRCFVYAAVVFLSMNVLFVQPYYNIYCDQAVTMWAGALIAWIIFGNNRKGKQLFVVMAVANISFMKSMMGPIFACVVLLSMLIKCFMEYGPENGNVTHIIRQMMNVKNIIYSGICIISVFLFSFLWSVYIGRNAVVWGETSAQSGIDRFELTLNSGLSKLFQPVNLSTEFPNITYFIYFVVVMLIGWWFAKKYLLGELKKQYSLLIGFYSIGFIFFFVLMIYAYLTKFSYADSIVTGSFNRYMSDYMLLGFIPVIFPAFRCKWNMDRVKDEITVGATCLLLFFVLSTTNGFFNKVTSITLEKTSNYTECLNFENYKDAALKLMDDDKRIYMINQNSNGYFTVVADYVFEKLIDRSGMCYYFSSNDVEIAGLSKANIRALPEILLQNNYGYLWIYRIDDYFSSIAFDILKIPKAVSGDFYKVINSNGRLELEYLGNISE